MLAEEADATKKGGQELIGGLDIKVHRNHFGRQIKSFVADLNLPFLAEHDSGESARTGAISAVTIIVGALSLSYRVRRPVRTRKCREAPAALSYSLSS